jgi:hypothetical protein
VAGLGAGQRFGGHQRGPGDAVVARGPQQEIVAVDRSAGAGVQQAAAKAEAAEARAARARWARGGPGPPAVARSVEVGGGGVGGEELRAAGHEQRVAGGAEGEACQGLAGGQGQQAGPGLTAVVRAPDLVGAVGRAQGHEQGARVGRVDAQQIEGQPLGVARAGHDGGEGAAGVVAAQEEQPPLALALAGGVDHLRLRRCHRQLEHVFAVREPPGLREPCAAVVRDQHRPRGLCQRVGARGGRIERHVDHRPAACVSGRRLGRAGGAVADDPFAAGHEHRPVGGHP